MLCAPKLPGRLTTLLYVHHQSGAPSRATANTQANAEHGGEGAVGGFAVIGGSEAPVAAAGY